MPLTIDTTSYDKAAHYPVGHGYLLRPAPPTSAVIHSTNNPKKNTSFASEADFLFRSADVSADFLIGKDGTIVQFLDSARYQAWHAGGLQTNGVWTAKPAFANPRSIGIELHHSVGDGAYPVAQEDALTALVRHLMARFHLLTNLIDTHRAIALPAGRKSDPSDWSDASFYTWRDGLVPLPVELPPRDEHAADALLWGPIATPQGDQWSWASVQAWVAHKARLGRCRSHLLYDDDNHAITQLFERGVIRSFGETNIWEACYL